MMCNLYSLSLLMHAINVSLYFVSFYANVILGDLISMSQDIEVTNKYGKLCLHKRSKLGVIQDYMISFEENDSNIEGVLSKTLDLFQDLMRHFDNQRVKARLIAQVHYIRLNDQHEIIGDEDYHFASYRAEEVFDANQFYERHMCKIASRMDSFHKRGSRLLIHCIKHIHIQVSR